MVLLTVRALLYLTPGLNTKCLSKINVIDHLCAPRDEYRAGTHSAGGQVYARFPYQHPPVPARSFRQYREALLCGGVVRTRIRNVRMIFDQSDTVHTWTSMTVVGDWAEIMRLGNFWTNQAE